MQVYQILSVGPQKGRADTYFSSDDHEKVYIL